MTTCFDDRSEAGRRLAERLAELEVGDAVVLGLARGGVPVGAPIARAIGCPLDALIVRKLGAPSQPELGFGAVTEGGQRVLNRSLIAQLGLSDDDIEAVTRAEAVEVARRVERYRDGQPMDPVEGKVVIVVDDGIATGSTAAAAIALLRTMAPARIILAVPVAATDAVERLTELADEVVVLATPRFFRAVGEWYRDFDAVSDDEVATALAAVNRSSGDDPRSS